MQRGQLRTLNITALILGVAPVVLAHGEDGGNMNMDSMLSVSEGASKLAPEEWPPSYFRDSAHSRLMMAHIVLMVVGWFIIAPLGMFLGRYCSCTRTLTIVSLHSECREVAIYPTHTSSFSLSQCSGSARQHRIQPPNTRPVCE